MGDNAKLSKRQDIWKKTGIAGAVYLSFKYILPLMIPFLLAFFIVYLQEPLLRKIRKRLPMKRGILSAVLLLFFGGILCLAGFFFFRALYGQLVSLLENHGILLRELDGMLGSCCSFLEDTFGFQAGSTRVYIMEQVQIAMENVKIQVVPTVFQGSVSCVKLLGEGAAFLGILCLSVILLGGDWDRIRAYSESSEACLWLKDTFQSLLQALGGYVKAQLTIMCIIMLICVIGLFLTGHEYALLKGVGIGLLDALPMIGTSIVFVPCAVFKVFQGEYAMALTYLVLYGICTVSREFLEPKLIGGRLGIWPIGILMAVVIGVKLYGLSGLFVGPISLLVIKELWARVEKATIP